MFGKNYLVYVIKSTSGHHKIGYSNNPQRRLKELQKTKGPYEFSIEGMWSCADRAHAVAFERYLHNLFSDRRVNGEWFNLSTADLIHIGEAGLYRYDSETGEFAHPW